MSHTKNKPNTEINLQTNKAHDEKKEILSYDLIFLIERILTIPDLNKSFEELVLEYKAHRSYHAQFWEDKDLLDGEAMAELWIKYEDRLPPLKKQIKRHPKNSTGEFGWLITKTEWIDERYLLIRTPVNPFVVVYDFFDCKALFFHNYPIQHLVEIIRGFKGKGSVLIHLQKIAGKSTLRRGAL